MECQNYGLRKGRIFPVMHPLSVGIIPHIPYAFGHGGLEVQQDRTMQALRELGVDVQPIDPWKRSFDADLLHVFGSEYHQGVHVDRATSLGIPTVVTSMFMMMQARWKFSVWKAIDRFLPPTTQTIRRRILHAADAVIAINRVERDDLVEVFDVDPDKIHVIANGVDDRFFHATPDMFVERYGVRDMVLCVGTIEPRKNQLQLIHATADLGVPLVLIGPVLPMRSVQDYGAEVEAAVQRASHVTWIKGLDHDDPVLASAFAAAAVHVLPSTAEAQGLVTLEAAAAGAAVVVSDLPSLRSIFRDDVTYVNPLSHASIRQAVLSALSRPRPGRLATPPEWLMTWQQVAMRTIDVYRSVLEH